VGRGFRDRHTVSPGFRQDTVRLRPDGAAKLEIFSAGRRNGRIGTSFRELSIFQIGKHEISVLIFQESSLHGRLREKRFSAEEIAFN